MNEQVTVMDDGTVQITTQSVQQVSLDDYKASLQQRLTDLQANQASYQPLIDEVLSQLAALN